MLPLLFFLVFTTKFIASSSSAFTEASVATGGYHTCFYWTGGHSKCWGYNQYGQLGLGTTVTLGNNPDEMGDNLAMIDLGTGRYVSNMACGLHHTCAVLDDNTVKCWGSGWRGALGSEDQVNRGGNPTDMGDNLPALDLGSGTQTPVQLCSSEYNCLLSNDGSVRCWGINTYGQLGVGHTNPIGFKSTSPFNMGDSVLPVDLGTGRTATSISCGVEHVCALLDDSTLKCWGDSSSGQLGYEDKNTLGNQLNELGDNLNAIDLGTGRTAVVVAAGGTHTCAILDDDSTKCWGDNSNGQLGQGDTTDRGGTASTMGDNLPAIDLGTGRTAVSISLGMSHTCSVLDNGSGKCWGLNTDGQLGYGDTDDRGDGTGEMGDSLAALDMGTGRTFSKFSLGRFHTCALLDDESLKCWGQNQLGQLGMGDTVDYGHTAATIGDNLPSIDHAIPKPTASPTQAPTSSPTSASPTTTPTSYVPTMFPTSSTPTLSPTSLTPTLSPTTTSPTSAAPTTVAPTTKTPTTMSPTLAPTSVSPTLSPTTATPTLSPTTLTPTMSPTTVAPTSKAPTTFSPTLSPTTLSPTLSPTTAAPTTSPTTAAPTTSPTTYSPTFSPTPPSPSPPPFAPPPSPPPPSPPPEFNDAVKLKLAKPSQIKHRGSWKSGKCCLWRKQCVNTIESQTCSRRQLILCKRELLRTGKSVGLCSQCLYCHKNYKLLSTRHLVLADNPGQSQLAKCIYNTPFAKAKPTNNVFTVCQKLMYTCSTRRDLYGICRLSQYDMKAGFGVTKQIDDVISL